jgi:hypothetical protein
MSQSIILACATTCDLAVLSGILEPTATQLSASFLRAERETQILGAGHSFYLAVSEVSDPDAMALEYEADEALDTRFRREVLGLRFYLVRFDEFGAARRVLFEMLARLDELGMTPWVDTDYGWVISGSEMVAQMKRDPLWDWRKAAPGSVVSS